MCGAEAEPAWGRLCEAGDHHTEPCIEQIVSETCGGLHGGFAQACAQGGIGGEDAQHVGQQIHIADRVGQAVLTVPP